MSAKENKNFFNYKIHPLEKIHYEESTLNILPMLYRIFYFPWGS